MKIEKNKLHLIHVESWHNAVFQCVAENDQGMNVSSVWVEVEGKYSFLRVVVLKHTLIDALHQLSIALFNK